MSERQQCPTGKVPLDAQRAQQLARRSSAKYDCAMTAYRCPDCGAWHLGSSSKLRRPLPLILRNHQANVRHHYEHQQRCR